MNALSAKVGTVSEPVFFIVDGEPRPKQSYRALKTGGGYQTARVKAWQNTVAWQAKQAMVGREPIEGNIAVRMIFTLGNNRRVDIDNLSKGTLDAMREIVFRDDCQITNLHVVKRVGGSAGVFIEVEPGGLLPMMNSLEIMG